MTCKTFPALQRTLVYEENCVALQKFSDVAASGQSHPRVKKPNNLTSSFTVCLVCLDHLSPARMALKTVVFSVGSEPPSSQMISVSWYCASNVAAAWH